MPIATVTLEPARVKRIARMMKTVGHPSRLMIVELLLERGRLPVKDIYEAIDISQSNASQHLKALEEVGVLRSEREGKNIFYQIGNEKISHVLACVGDFTER
ncbi:MAG: ArsR family transcriptional regulator [Bacteroidetes bacterium]|jgi:DNA-binding transcriptional ArsR family regulator|nr:MAG: ArsR family transcriptional regulator [Bacteroidota bacterium]